MTWTLIVLIFAGTNAFFGGAFLGFFAHGWKRKPPVRAIALAGLALAAPTMIFLNGLSATPSATVCLFCAGVLFLGHANENLCFATRRCELKASLRVFENVRLLALGGLILTTASMVFINGPAAILATGVCYVCGVLFALPFVIK